jgi:antitoxin component YwqK of YwqJK toxin-antitoxin module
LAALIVVITLEGCGEHREVEAENLLERGGLKYEVNSEQPFTGTAISYYENGQKYREGELRNGNLHGEVTEWYENGQK